MKYRSITLNNNKDKIISLVKYESKYKRKLDKFENIDSWLESVVKQGPKIYSELSEYQSYMIFSDECYCIGLIYIGTSTDEKNLEIQLQFNNNYFDFDGEKCLIIDQIVDSLGLYFYDKENIEIRLVDNIDLSEYDCFGYKKMVYDENLTTYVYSNSYYNKLMPLLIKEINDSENIMKELGMYWTECIYRNSDFSYIFDKELIDEYKKGFVSSEEIFNKAKSLKWTNIKSNNAVRSIEFFKDGDVMFTKESNKKNGISYNFDYRVLGREFDFKCNNGGNLLEINENGYFTDINYSGTFLKNGKVNIFCNKDCKRKRIEYSSEVINNTSIFMQLLINEDDEIERCYVDFRTHKGNGKINGMYVLRIIPRYMQYTLKHISRDGSRGFDFFEKVFEDDINVMNSELNIELINMIVKKIISVINCRTMINGKKYVFDDNELVLDLENIEKYVVDFMKQIRGELPLPNLVEKVDAFIENNIKYEKDNSNLMKLRKLDK